jgi:hypothetical protein
VLDFHTVVVSCCPRVCAAQGPVVCVVTFVELHTPSIRHKVLEVVTVLEVCQQTEQCAR